MENLNKGFARFPDFASCTLEQTKLGHNIEDANKICGEIQMRAEKGLLMKAQPLALEVLSKADEDRIVVGGYASWDCVDDDGDIFTADAQSKALERFFAQAPEYQLVTINHGKGALGEIKAAQPQLKYINKAGEQYFSHVNEVGTYLLSEIRNDSLASTKYVREKARRGEYDGYSVNAIPLVKDPSNPHRVLDMEYTAITITEKGVFRPRNPHTRNVEVLSKGEDLAVINDEGKFVPLPDADMNIINLEAEDKAAIEAILARYGFSKTKKD
jgi:hypothetical protein